MVKWGVEQVLVGMLAARAAQQWSEVFFLFFPFLVFLLVLDDCAQTSRCSFPVMVAVAAVAVSAKADLVSGRRWRPFATVTWPCIHLGETAFRFG